MASASRPADRGPGRAGGRSRAVFGGNDASSANVSGTPPPSVGHESQKKIRCCSRAGERKRRERCFWSGGGGGVARPRRRGGGGGWAEAAGRGIAVVRTLGHRP